MHMKKTISNFLFLFCLFLLFHCVPIFAYSASSSEIGNTDELYQGVGIDQEHAIYGNNPTESIDPFNGS